MPLSLVQNLRLWRREIRPTWALALPIMAGMVSQMLMGLADALMVGRVGVVPLAAASFVNAVAHLPLVLGMGLLTCISVLTSQAYGARRSDEAGELLRHGLVLSAAVGLLAALTMFALRPFLDHLGQPPEVVAAAKNYLLLYGGSLLPGLVAHGAKQFSDALKHPWLPTVVMLGGVGLNVLLNWILIYGNCGAPALGLEGSGWATLISRTVIAVVLVGYVVDAPALRKFQPARWRGQLTWERFQRMLKVGWPVGAQHFFEVSAFASAAIMMGWINADAMAAHQIAITCAAMTFMSALGIGAAAGIRVGHAFGAGQFARVRRIGFSGVGMAATFMGAFGVLFALAGKNIATLFIESPAVVNLTAQLLIVAAVFQIVDGIQVSAISALRGLSDVRVPAMIAIVAYWFIALPVGAALAFGAKLGAVGMWIGLALGLGAAAAGLLWRFHRKTQMVCVSADAFATAPTRLEVSGEKSL
ncbi:MAG: MATE family efflux transporter [Verrucomicrobia bacterium]|nr:MAG: MATE family efflux transporter [Verrucomicrobiota bacterium]